MFIEQEMRFPDASMPADVTGSERTGAQDKELYAARKMFYDSSMLYLTLMRGAS